MKRTTTNAIYHRQGKGLETTQIEGYATSVPGLTIHRPHEFSDGINKPPTHISRRYWVLTATCGYVVAQYFPRRKDALAFAEEVALLFPEIKWQDITPDFEATDQQRRLAQRLMNKWRRHGFYSQA